MLAKQLGKIIRGSDEHLRHMTESNAPEVSTRNCNYSSHLIQRSILTSAKVEDKSQIVNNDSLFDLSRDSSVQRLKYIGEG